MTGALPSRGAAPAAASSGLTITGQTVHEAVGQTATFGLTLASPPPSSTVFYVETRVTTDPNDVDASPGTDYVTVTNGTVTFAANETHQLFDVTVNDDAIIEKDETLALVAFAEATKPEPPIASGTSTITDDDTKVRVVGETVTEGTDGVATFTLTQGLAGSGDRDVRAQTFSSTAVAGEDYTAQNVVVPFTANGVTTVDVPILNDSASENREKFAMLVFDAASGDLLGLGDAHICDDENPSSCGTPRPSAAIRAFKSSQSTYKSSSQAKYKLLQADPVNPIFGNFTDAHTDLSMSGPGLGASIGRSYNSDSPGDSILGFGWNIAYDMEITRPDATSVNLRYHDGRVDPYTVAPDGSLIPAPGSVQRLVANQDGTFDLTAGELGDVSHFNAAGELESITDRNGNRLTFTHSGGNWTGITDAIGRNWTIEYNGAGRIAKITDPAGRFVTYGYDAAGNLTTVTDPRGSVTTFEYDGDHQLTRTTDALGNLVIQNVYVAQQVTQQTDGRGGVHTFTYEPGKTTYTDPVGGVWVTEFDQTTFERTRTTDAEGGVTILTYNADELVGTETDPRGGVTAYEYDARGNTTKVTDPLGGVSIYTYDANDNLLTFTDPLGRTRINTYDAEGNTITSTDATGATMTMGYDGRGLGTTIEDAAGRVTTMMYDALGLRTTMTDPTGAITSYTYDTAGRVTSETDALGRVRTKTYDAINNVTSATEPGNLTTTMTYDSLGNLLTTTDPLGHQTSHTYEAIDLVGLEDAAGRVTSFDHDLLGRVTQTTMPDGTAETLEYDGVGRVLRKTTDLGRSTEMEYDLNGNLTKRTDPAGHATTFTYDALDRQTGTTDASGATQQFSYNAVGGLTSTTNAADKVTTFTYDEEGRRTQTIDPLGRTDHVAYNPTGTVATKTNGAGQVVTYDYDNRDRVLSITADGFTTQFTYDAIGRRTTMIDRQGTTTYGYDAAGRIVEIASPQGTLTYAYDAAGNRTQLTQPDQTLGYTYDPSNLLTGVSTGGSSIVDYDLDDVGRIESADFGNGVRTTYTYDDDGRITRFATSSTTKTLEDFSYTYDAAGNRTSEVALRGRSAFEYDVRDQLVGFDRTAGKKTTTTDYTYDAVGNRTKVINGSKVATAVFDDANQLTGGMTPFTNDDGGRRITGRGATYTYDSFDHLVSVTEKKTTTTYLYDGDGIRVGQSVQKGTKPGKVTQYLVDPLGQLPRVVAFGDTRLIYGNGAVVAQATGTGPLIYDHTDALGSVRFQTTSTGKKTNTSEFDPFGARLKGQGVLGFAGELQTGSLVHLRARDLDAVTGRFLSADPMEGTADRPLTFNHYSYSDNNPVNREDPTGLMSEWASSEIKNRVLWAKYYTDMAAAYNAWTGWPLLCPYCAAWGAYYQEQANIWLRSAVEWIAYYATPPEPPTPPQSLTDFLDIGFSGTYATPGRSLVDLAKPVDVASLIGLDGGSFNILLELIGQDGGSLIGLDGGSLTKFANLIGLDGGSLIGLDGGSLATSIAGLISDKGVGLIGQDGGSLIGNSGNTLVSVNHPRLAWDNIAGLTMKVK